MISVVKVVFSMVSLVVSVLVYRSLAAIGHVEGVMPPAAFTSGTVVNVIRLAKLASRLRRAFIIQDHHHNAQQTRLDFELVPSAPV